MRERPLVAAVALSLAILSGPGRAAASDTQDFDQVERGRYLATVGDCEACHNDTLGGRPHAGGRAIETPFGNILAPNITPDRDTGIGAWTDDEFVGALRKGTGRHGAHLYPAMPFPYMTKTTREDALAIRAYLNTIPGVRHEVVADQLPFPLNIRAGMLAWDALYFKEGEFQPVAGKSEDWNRGAYLVEGLAHCGACHTSKDALGGDKTAAAFQGSRLQGWWAPNITNDPRGGIGNWSTADIVAYLSTGHNRFASASGPMAEEVTLSSSRMTQTDLRAIATYLKDQPGSERAATPVEAGAPAMKAGAAIYRDECSACHKPDGSGIPQLFPDLRHLGSVQSSDPASLLRVVIQGAHGVATDPEPTGPAMPSFGWLLSDDQVAAVATYVRNSWGNAAPAVAAAEVGKARGSLANRSD